MLSKDELMAFSKSPIFIGGLFKSGTTLLRAMLGQHSNLASGLETQWFNIKWDGVKQEEFHDHISRLSKFYEIDEALAKAMVAESDDIYQFINLFLGQFAKSEGKRRWVEKTPGNVIHLEKIFRAWPDARVIHVIRDPRDVFASLKQAKKWDTVEEFVKLWCLYLGSVEKWKKGKNSNREKYLEIRYEDLVRESRKSMELVIEFIEEAWEDGVAEFKGKKDEYNKVYEITGKASTTLDRLREPLSRKRIGIWSKIVSHDEIYQIHEAVQTEGLLALMKTIEDYTA